MGICSELPYYIQTQTERDQAAEDEAFRIAEELNEQRAQNFLRFMTSVAMEATDGMVQTA